MYRELQTFNKTLVKDGLSKLGDSKLQDISGQSCYLKKKKGMSLFIVYLKALSINQGT